MRVDSERVVLIVNPVAGGGRGRRVLDRAVPLLRQAGIAAQVVVCANGDEPTAAARRAADDGARVVVAVGGDGHAAAVAEGIIGSATSLALLPAGSANDYARALGVPRRDVAGAVAVIAAGNAARVDTVRVAIDGRERHYLNVIGAGFDAVVAARAERIPVLRGAGRYVVAIMRELPRFSAATFELVLDGRLHQQRAMMVVLAKGTTYGGGMRVAPMAQLTGGWIEVCIVGEVSKTEFLRAFPRVFRGTHVDHPAVTMLRARKVELSGDRPLELIGDGDLTGRLPATVTVEPASLSVVVGRGVIPERDRAASSQ